MWWATPPLTSTSTSTSTIRLDLHRQMTRSFRSHSSPHLHAPDLHHLPLPYTFTPSHLHLRSATRGNLTGRFLGMPVQSDVVLSLCLHANDDDLEFVCIISILTYELPWPIELKETKDILLRIVM